MHIHLPKPLHGWREFAGEVGIIVIGVLIALGAEQIVEQWHWHRQVEESKRALKAELTVNAWDAYERLAIQPCLQGRLNALARQIDAGDGEWRAMPETFIGAKRFYSWVLPPVYRPPTRPVFSDAWRNALADGTVAHLDLEEAQHLSSAYQSSDAFNDQEAEEARTETRLSPLATDRHLDERSRLEMLQTIAELDRLNGLLVTSSNDLFSAIRNGRLGFSRSEVEALRQDVVQTQRGYRGSCVIMPPLDLGQG